MPADVRASLRWIAGASRPLQDLADTQTLREVAEAMSTNLDGSNSAATVVRRRAVLFNALEFAKERDLLTPNPLESFKWRPPKLSHAVDRRSVVNPDQARALLRALGDERPRGARSDEWESSGPRLVAFYALMYFAALRPEEAVSFRDTDAVLPAAGWGELHLERSTPDVGRDWTDTGAARDVRQLKHRGRARSGSCPAHRS